MSFAVGPESVVLSGTTAASLAYPNIISGSVVVRSRHPDGTDTSWPHLNVIASNVTYVEGVDYTVDYTAGTIARTAGSSIPNFASAGGAPNGANGAWIVWVTYTAAGTAFAATKTTAVPRFTARVAAGQPLKILVLGDSISTGAEAERYGIGPNYDDLPLPTTILKAHPYYVQWPGYIRDTFGCATTVIMRAQGATTSTTLADDSINAARVTQAYDLIILAFGMNGAGGGASDFTHHIDWVRANSASYTEFILMSGCTNYAGGGTIKSILDTVATSRSGVYVADGTARWATLVGGRKGYRSCLRNDTNHPTSFGHMLYTEALMAAVPDANPLTLDSDAVWSQSGTSLTVSHAPIGSRSSVRGTALSSGGGLVRFTGANANRFTCSLDGSTWTSTVTIPVGTTAVYLSALPQSGDTTLSASVGIPV